MDHGGMSMGGDSSSSKPACKISMLLNYNTVDACFISSDWQVRSAGMFAGTCIGIFLLCFALEAVRRAGREYDRRLVKQAKARAAANANAEVGTPSADEHSGKNLNSNGSGPLGLPAHMLTRPTWSPTFVQHLVRSVVYGLCFTTAYFVMLLGMYYNVYILVCIFLGHFLGYIVFGRDTLGADLEGGNATGRCC